MSRRKRILLWVAASLATLLVVLMVAAIVTVQTPWFAGFVREKIIAAAEDSTGGRAELGSFELDLAHLTVKIRNFVLHGKEPPGSDPLFRVKLLELRLKLLSGFGKVVDLRYLGIEEPRVNVLLLPDGTTNIPEPKKKSPPSQNSGLQTVVNLAVSSFRLINGQVKVLQQASAFSGRGENLRVLLDYNALKPGYSGSVRIDPLILASGARPPLNLTVSVPVTIERDAIRIEGARLSAPESQVLLSGVLENTKTPVINARLQARLSLPEIQRSIALPIDTTGVGAPKLLTAEIAVNLNEGSHALQIQTAHAELGRTTLRASGRLDPQTREAVQFEANFALSELSKLLQLNGVELSGDLKADGRATTDRQSNYAIDGTINSRGLAVRSSDTQLSNLSLYAPFHADPYLVSMDGLRFNALGGSLGAKIFLEKLQTLSVEGRLRNFSIPVLVTAFTGKQLGYDASLDGTIQARGDLKAKGTTGYTAKTDLGIIPGRHGIPLSGRLKANYIGASGSLDLAKSYVMLPNSRLDLAGSLNKRIDVDLVSHNLNDFLPAANFGAAKPQTSLPVVLDGGALTLHAQATGNTASPNVTAHLDLDDFLVEQRPFDRFALDLAAAPAGAQLRNGILTGKALTTNFDGSIGLRRWAPTPASPVEANLTLRNGDLADLMRLAGQSTLDASGAAVADLHIRGTYGNPLGGAMFQVMDGSVSQQAFSKLYANVNLADQLVTLSKIELDTAGGSIEAHGTFQHPRESFTVGQAQIQASIQNLQLGQIQALVKQNAGISGVVQFNASAAAQLQNKNSQTSASLANVTADLSARGLRIQNQDAGELTASARTGSGKVDYRLDSNFAGSDLKLRGNTALADGYRTVADASIRQLSVAKALQMAGQSSIPARGQLSAGMHVNGTVDSPNANLDLDLLDANIYREAINSLTGQVKYSNRLVEIPSIELDVPAGKLTVSGSYNHPPSNFNAGSLVLKITSSDIELAKIYSVQAQKPGLAGTVHVAANLAANLREEQGKRVLLISNLDADAAMMGLHVNSARLGGLTFQARTKAANLDLRLDSDIAQSRIHGTGQAKLSGEYPLSGSLSFANIRYANLAPFVTAQPAAPPPFEGLVEGGLTFNGLMARPDDFAAKLHLDQLDFKTNTTRSPTGSPALRKVELQNQGPIVVGLDHQVVKIEQFHITGRKSSINASGTVNLKNAFEPLALNLDANVDLEILQDADRDFYSSGSLNLNTSVRGSFAQPRANGRVELKNANVNYAGAPNGLSNANGVILLNGTNASIEKLTGESGGGRIELAGFVGLGTRVPSFNLKATAAKVRVRSSGVSTTSNANLSLTGNLRRSLLAGTISIERIAYASSSDAGSLLSTASTPPLTPASPNPLLSGMRLAVHVLTAPDLQVVSTYANRLSVLANLTVRGTADNPGMLGRVTVTDGQLVFFGNTYTVTTGTVNFYDPNAISPNLNVSLQTIAQGVNVTIGVTGPIEDLKLSYRSDPPLTFEQIVQLLATNTTPANPVIAAHQPSPPQQSFTQMGQSAILGQAVANPLASRVQRVFGLTQFKIDPSFTGNNGQPSARVTLQQKIASNITFTYITDVSRANAQIVRVEWDLTNNLSAVGLRDYNGAVSIEFFYKFTKR